MKIIFLIALIALSSAFRARLSTKTHSKTQQQNTLQDYCPNYYGIFEDCADQYYEDWGMCSVEEGQQAENCQTSWMEPGKRSIRARFS